LTKAPETGLSRRSVVFGRRMRHARPMGLKEFFSRWSKGEDERAIERADNESRMTAEERAVDREDFEGRKDDTAAGSSWAGSEAASAADVDDRD
jgi:hypothetical protein